MVNPKYISHDFSIPTQVKCDAAEGSHIHPFDDYLENPASWILRTVAYEPDR